MDSFRLLIEQYARAAWRRRWIGMLIAWLICGAGWVGVYLVPNQYESSARLYVDADAILTPLLVMALALLLLFVVLVLLRTETEIDRRRLEAAEIAG